MLNQITNAESNFRDQAAQKSTAQLLAQALASSASLQGARKVDNINSYPLGDQVSISPEARRLLEEIHKSQELERDHILAQDSEMIGVKSETNKQMQAVNSSSSYAQDYSNLGSRNTMLKSYNLERDYFEGLNSKVIMQ